MPRTYTPAFRPANPVNPITKGDPRKRIINTVEEVLFYPSDHATEPKHFSGVIRMRHRRASSIANIQNPSPSGRINDPDRTRNIVGSPYSDPPWHQPPRGYGGDYLFVFYPYIMQTNHPTTLTYQLGGPTAAGRTVLWSVISGSGTIDQSGTYDPGPNKHFAQIRIESNDPPVALAADAFSTVYDPLIAFTTPSVSIDASQTGVLYLPLSASDFPESIGGGHANPARDLFGYDFSASAGLYPLWGSSPMEWTPPYFVNGNNQYEAVTGTYYFKATSRTFPDISATAQCVITPAVTASGPTITAINAVSNIFGATPFRLLVGQGMAITGTLLNQITDIQFEPYGPDNSGPPNYTLIPPAGTATGQWLPPSGTTQFSIVDAQHITVSAVEIQNLNVNYGLAYNTWYKVVLSY
jgi:hypothetical protein